MDDEFLTLAHVSEGYYIDRGSKYLAYASPVLSEKEANLFLQKIKKDHPKARHYCTALRLFPDASLERSNDDREPSGSAGRPILGQLVKNNLTNIMIVAVRYFGGTKLGVPGLIEAYKTCAFNAIMTGIIVKRKVFTTVRIDMAYEQLPSFLNHCRQSSIPVFDEVYKETPSIILGFSRSKIHEELKTALQQFIQMDFNTLEDYTQHLNMVIQMLHDDKIM